MFAYHCLRLLVINVFGMYYMQLPLPLKIVVKELLKYLAEILLARKFHIKHVSKVYSILINRCSHNTAVNIMPRLHNALIIAYNM